MNQYMPQEEVRHIIISDMVKKWNSFVPNSTLTSIKDGNHYELVLLSLYLWDFPLVLLWLSDGALKWIRSAFLDEPSGQAEREEGSKVIRRYTPLTSISSLPHKASLVAPRALCS